MRDGWRRWAGEAMAGAASGVAASWIMSAVLPAIEKAQPDEDQERERELQEKPALRVAAERTAALAGRELRGKQKRDVPLLIHYAYGAIWGAAWALLRRRFRALGPFGGAAFGAAVWAISDEALVPMLRFTPPPWRYPLSTHLRGLGAHLVYGTATDGGIRLAARALA